MAPGNLSRLGFRFSCANRPILRNCSSVSWTSLPRASSSALGISCLAMMYLSLFVRRARSPLWLQQAVGDGLLSPKHFPGAVVIAMTLGTIGPRSYLRIVTLPADIDRGQQHVRGVAAGGGLPMALVAAQHAMPLVAED